MAAKRSEGIRKKRGEGNVGEGEREREREGIQRERETFKRPLQDRSQDIMEKHRRVKKGQKRKVKRGCQKTKGKPDNGVNRGSFTSHQMTMCRTSMTNTKTG